MLRSSGLSDVDKDRLIEALETDFRCAEIDPADRQMLDYAVQLSKSPSTITAEDVDKLRQAGFSDRAIHDICAITAYFAFVNRIADGLGVTLERGAD